MQGSLTEYVNLTSFVMQVNLLKCCDVITHQLRSRDRWLACYLTRSWYKLTRQVIFCLKLTYYKFMVGHEMVIPGLSMYVFDMYVCKLYPKVWEKVKNKTKQFKHLTSPNIVSPAI